MTQCAKNTLLAAALLAAAMSAQAAVSADEAAKLNLNVADALASLPIFRMVSRREASVILAVGVTKEGLRPLPDVEATSEGAASDYAQSDRR